MSETTLAKRNNTDIAVVTPMALIEQANARGASIEQMTQLLDLQERWEANEAKKAFNAAMAEFKKNPPQIVKNKHVTHNNFWHATLDEIVAKVTPALSNVGIRFRWDIDQKEAPKIVVTCILSHELGHSESTPFEGMADTSGSKNPIQAIGSAITYGERYSLMAATGLAAVGQDDNGRAASRNFLEEVKKALKAESDPDKVVTMARKFYKQAKDDKDTETCAAIAAAQEARIKEITGQ